MRALIGVAMGTARSVVIKVRVTPEQAERIRAGAERALTVPLPVATFVEKCVMDTLDALKIPRAAPPQVTPSRPVVVEAPKRQGPTPRQLEVLAMLDAYRQATGGVHGEDGPFRRAIANSMADNSMCDMVITAVKAVLPKGGPMPATVEAPRYPAPKLRADGRCAWDGCAKRATPGHACCSIEHDTFVRVGHPAPSTDLCLSCGQAPRMSEDIVVCEACHQV